LAVGELHFNCRLHYESGFEVDAAFEAGEGVTALFGPSGSGKSTILSLVAGLLWPRSGRICLRDRILTDTATGRFVAPERRRLGVVFQDHQLFPHLTVRQNLRFGQGRHAGRPVDIGRVVEILEISDLLERRPDALSGGQRQRVALGRALLCGPELLLMDEPLAGLDEGLKDRVLSYLSRALAQWNIPTLLVSHDQADVRRLATCVVVIENGRVVASGPTAQTLDRALLTRPAQKAVPLNLLRVTDLCQVDGHWQGRVSGQTMHLPSYNLRIGCDAYVQFQPHDVVLAHGLETACLSVRNRMEGVIREILLLDGRAFVAVDIGQFLWAEVTPEAVRDLGLRPGEAVACLIKTSCIAVLG
jgi:molybdate transport system ATP-binding protein